MPIKLDNKLPALDVLRSENVFIMDENRASSQDIRPMEVLILNLMPTKEVTETQLLRLLANTPLQINVEFLYMASHKSKNTHAEHMETFYKTFDEIKHKYYDGLIVTGAPVEQMPFEEVDYWQELTQVFDWSKKHVYSTLHLCWGAQAGLYYKHGVDKVPLSEKLSGIYKQTVDMPENFLMNGFDDSFVSPHSRYTEVTLEDIKNKTDLDIVVSGPEVGLSILASKNLREVYSFGHFEYDVILWPENTEEIWMQGLIQTYQQTISQRMIQVRSLNFVGILRHLPSLAIGLTMRYIKKHLIV